MSGWIYLVVAIASEIVGTTSLNFSQGFSKPLPSIAVVIGYGLSFYFLSLALKTIPIGIAYAVWGGIGISLMCLIGIFVFRQKLDWGAGLGVGLILTGVIVINVFSRTLSRH